MAHDIPEVLDWVKSVFDKADGYVVVCEIVLNRPFDPSSTQYILPLAKITIDLAREIA